MNNELKIELRKNARVLQQDESKFKLIMTVKIG
jgi:hypothetical protein